MKKLLFGLVATIMFGLTGNAQQGFDFKTKPLEIEVVNKVSDYLKSKYQKDDIFNGSVNLDIDLEFQRLLAPLVANGKELHDEILNELKNSQDWQKLSQEDQNLILKFDEKKYAGLAISYSGASTARFSPRVESCLAVATGAVAIYDLIINSAALGTVQTLIGAIRLIGRRYLGWLGVAAMVWEFSDCMNG